MALELPTKVGDARPIWLMREPELATLKAIAGEMPAGRTRNKLEAVIAKLKTTYFGKGMIEQDFRSPSGKVESFNLWHSPGVPGVFEARPSIMFPVTTDGKVIVIRQWRPAAAVTDPDHSFIYELPGGNPRKGTTPTPAEVAEMELLEETGYRAKRWEALSLTTNWWEPANFTPSYHALLGIGCERVSDPQPDPTELIEVRVIPLHEWFRLIVMSEVRDSKSLAITLLALIHLGKVEDWRRLMESTRRAQRGAQE